MAGDKRRLLENFISLGALQIVSYIIPLIALPYQTRVLGADKFGLIYFAYAIMGYFIILTDYGFELSATREIAMHRHNSANSSNIFNSVMVIKVFLLIFSYGILCLISLFIPKIHDNFIVFQLSFLMVVGNAIYPVWFFQGMERMKYITFLNILSKLIFLISIFIFVHKEEEYVLVPLLNSLGFLISGFIGFIFAVRNFKLKLYIPKWKSICNQFRYSSDFFLSRISVTALGNTNTFCLGLISSNTLVAYYVAAEKICIAIKGLQIPIKNAMYPYISKYKDVKLYKKVFFITCFVNVFVCMVMFIFAKEFISLFYGENLIESYKILRIFCTIILITCPSTLLGYPLLGAMGYTKEANRSVVLASIFHIAGLGILYMLDKISIYAIAYLVLVSETVLFLQWAYYVFKYKLLKEDC